MGADRKQRSWPRRWLRRVLIGVPLALLALLLLVGALLGLLHTDIGLEQARRLALHFTRDMLPGLQIKRITGGITNKLRVEGIVLKDINGGEAVRVKSLRLRYDLTALRDKKIVLHEVVLERPRVTAVMRDGVLNLSQLVKLEPKEEEEPPSGPLRWTAKLGALRVLKGAGSFEQGDQRYAVRELDVDLGGGVDLATLAASLKLTAVRARATVPGQPEVTLDLRGKARWDGEQRVDAETVLELATSDLQREGGKKVASIIPVAIAPNKKLTANLDASGPLSRLEVKLGLRLPDRGTVGLGGHVGLKLDDGFSLGPFSAKVKLAHVDPAPLVPQLKIKTDLNLALEVSGVGIPLQPGSRSRLDLKVGPSSVLAYKVDSLVVQGGLTARAWKLGQLVARAAGADLRVTGEGTLKKIKKSRIKLNVPSLARLPLPASVPPLGGAVSADLAVAGPLKKDLSVKGSVTVTAVAVAGLHLGTGKVTLDVEGLPNSPSGLLQVEAAGLRSVKGKRRQLLLSRGAVKITGRRQRLVVEADISRPDLRAGLGLTASLSAELPPKRIGLRLHRLSARHKKLAARLLNRPRVDVQLGRLVKLEPLRLAALGGEVDLAAVYRFKAQPRLEARVKVKKVRPVPGPPLSAELTALLDRRALAARLRADVAGANRVTLDARVPVTYHRGVPRPSKRAPLALKLRAPALDLGLLNRFAPRAPKVGGTVALAVLGGGTLAAPRLDLRLTLARVTNPYLAPLSGKARVTMGRKASAVKLQLAHDGRKLVSLDAGAGLTVARLMGRTRDLLRSLSRVPARARLTVHETPLPSLASIYPLLGEASGTVGADVDLTGTLRDPRVGARLRVRDGRLAGQKLGTILANASLTGGPSTRGALSLSLGQMKLVQVSSEAQKTVMELIRQKDFTALPIKVKAVFPRVKLSALADYHRLLEITEGTFDGEATVAGTLKAPRAGARLRLTDASFNRRVLGDVTSRVTFDGRIFDLGLKLKQGKKGRARAAVSFDLKKRKGLRASLDAGHLDIGFLRELVPALREISGKLHGKVRVSGGIEAPAIKGNLRLANVAVRVSGAPALEQVNARVRLSEKQVKLVSLSARSGRGLLTAAGQVNLDKLRPTTFSLDARSTLFDLGVGPLKNSAFFGNLGVKGGLSKDNTLTADVRLRNGSLRLAGLGGDRKLHSTKPLPDVILEEPVYPKKKLRPPKDPKKPARPLKLKVKVVVEPLRVYSDDFDLEAETDIWAYTGPRGKLRLGGWAGLRKGGTLSLMGSRYTVERAKVRFQEKPEPDPTLDVVLSRHIQTVIVLINVGGSARAHKISFKSDPPNYTESQIIGMIATGRMEEASDDSGDEGGGDQKMTMANAMANALIGTVAGKMVSKVGLDVARVNVKEQEDENEEVQLQAQAEVGKYLTKDLYVGYRRIFGAMENENENEGILEYTFLPRWMLSAFFGDAQQGGVDVFWTYRY